MDIEIINYCELRNEYPINSVGLVGYSWHAIGLEVFRDIPTVCRMFVLFQSPPPLYTSHVKSPGISEAGAIVHGIS